MFAYVVGGHFDCMAMHHYLFKNNLSLEKLPYDKIQYDLLTHEVIASGEEILNIGFEVIENIQRDLYHNQANKFKVFLQIMEDSDVLLLQNTAKRLGKWINSSIVCCVCVCVCVCVHVCACMCVHVRVCVHTYVNSHHI